MIFGVKIKIQTLLWRKLQYDLDAIICFSAPFELRVKRIEERDQLNKSEINKIIDNQMSQEKKEQLSDYIIVNDEKKLILPQLINIIKEMEWYLLFLFF